MNKQFDYIVIGVGSMGSSTCYHLAKSGATVLGIEQFELVHERGAHSGQSRIVRKAYFEHPDYIPLLERAYQNWQDRSTRRSVPDKPQPHLGCRRMGGERAQLGN